jgi:hypothetical protein
MLKQVTSASAVWREIAAGAWVMLSGRAVNPAQIVQIIQDGSISHIYHYHLTSGAVIAVDERQDYMGVSKLLREALPVLGAVPPLMVPDLGLYMQARVILSQPHPNYSSHRLQDVSLHTSPSTFIQPSALVADDFAISDPGQLLNPTSGTLSLQEFHNLTDGYSHNANYHLRWQDTAYATARVITWKFTTAQKLNGVRVHGTVDFQTGPAFGRVQVYASVDGATWIEKLDAQIDVIDYQRLLNVGMYA